MRFQRSVQRTRTAEEIQAILPWVCCPHRHRSPVADVSVRKAESIQKRYPYRAPNVDSAASFGPPARIGPTAASTGSLCVLLPDASKAGPSLPSLVNANLGAMSIHAHIQRTESTLSQILQCITNSSGSPLESTPRPLAPPATYVSGASDDVAMSVDGEDQAGADNIFADNTFANDNTFIETRALELGNGVTIRFTEADVPNPPALTFANDISRLNCVWDDTSEFWDATQAPFAVKGEPIALVHWQALYSRWKGKQWDGLKKPYSNWKVCAFCCISSAASF
jgi:hypothetical protein